MRVIAGEMEGQPGLGGLMAVPGPWEGESTEELIEILREGRDSGGSSEPPEGF
jgi:hypothetical protein